MRLCREAGRLQQVVICSEPASLEQRIAELGSSQTSDCSLTFSNILDNKQVSQFDAMFCAWIHAIKHYISIRMEALAKRLPWTCFIGCSSLEGRLPWTCFIRFSLLQPDFWPWSADLSERLPWTCFIGCSSLEGRLQDVVVCSEPASLDQRIAELGSPQTLDCSLTFSNILNISKCCSLKPCSAPGSMP